MLTRIDITSNYIFPLEYRSRMYAGDSYPHGRVIFIAQEILG